jgi:hypothetical protein
VTRTLPISLAVVSLLFTLPHDAWAQTPPPATPSTTPPVSSAPVLVAPLDTTAPANPPPAQVASPPAEIAPPPPPPMTVYPAYAPPPPPPAPPASTSGGVRVELMSLRLMRDKGIISQAEYDSAAHDLADSSGPHMGDGTVVLGKWATTLYGFAEADSIYDTTRSFNDLAGSAVLQAAGTTGGDNSRVTFGVRNSRLGFRLKAPEVGGVRGSAVIETDFQGTQLPIVTGPYPSPYAGSLGQGTSPYGSEGTFFTSPTLRVRHLYLKVETPVVDILFGQYWTLFGWGASYQPNTVEIQGVPGEVYSRTPQFRISKTIKAHPITVELAVAAMRPVQRDSGTPDGQAGLRFSVDSWTGQQTTGSTGTQISPMSIAVSGLLRHVAVNDFNVVGTNTQDLTMSAIAVDGFIPVVPATKDHKDNAFSLQGELASGYGLADMYTGLSGGVGFPSPITPPGGATKYYVPDIDAGIVTYDGTGGLHAIQWTTFLLGAQYVLPAVDGKLLLSGNYSHMQSANSHYYTFGAANTGKVLAYEDWFDINFFYDPVPGVRFGAEYANFNDTMVNGIHAINHRGQFSGFFIF